MENTYNQCASYECRPLLQATNKQLLLKIIKKKKKKIFFFFFNDERNNDNHVGLKVLRCRADILGTKKKKCEQGA